MRRKRVYPPILVAVCLSLLMIGCSGPSKNKPSMLPVRPILSETVSQDDLTVEQLLAKAAISSFPENASLKLMAVSSLIYTDLVRAKSILDSLDYETLPTPLKEVLAIQQAQIADQLGQRRDVFDWVDREAIFSTTNPTTIVIAHTLRARAYNYFSEYLAALDEWLVVMPLLDKEQQSHYQGEFWQTLLHVPESRLVSLSNQVANEDMKGWLELAILYQPGTPLEQQLRGLQGWLRQHPGHLGNIYLPKNFEQLRASSSLQPKKIAVLLPLSGNLAKAGRSIRDGLIAASYDDLQSLGKAPELLIFDTNGKEINQLAEEAISQGAQLIIGPLDKNSVGLIKDEIAARIPILALNYLRGSGQKPPASIYQFGLSTEDEANMVVKRAMLDGHKRAIMLTPSSPWGKKAADAFSQAWLAAGGEIADHIEFDKQTEFSRMSGQLLHITESQQRARRLRLLLKESFSFQPRRRQDIDMIFIAASPAEARQIKPALSYQFAGSIPVYATSSVFSGKKNVARDRDIDDVRVPLMSWSVPGKTTRIKSTIIDVWPQSQGEYGTLYALGADAYKLYPKLQQLTHLPGSQVEGLTGWLSVNQDRSITRELTWQIFKNGRLRALPIKSAGVNYR